MSSRVLIVEDEAFVAMWLEMELKQVGLQIIRRVASGETAVDVACDEHPDIVLMDIRLAGEMDGIDAATQIGRCCKAALVFMTGYPDKVLEERAAKCNPLAYLIKPIRMDQLKRLIANPTRH